MIHFSRFFFVFGALTMFWFISVGDKTFMTISALCSAINYAYIESDKDR